MKVSHTKNKSIKRKEKDLMCYLFWGYFPWPSTDNH